MKRNSEERENWIRRDCVRNRRLVRTPSNPLPPFTLLLTPTANVGFSLTHSSLPLSLSCSCFLCKVVVCAMYTTILRVSLTHVFSFIYTHTYINLSSKSLISHWSLFSFLFYFLYYFLSPWHLSTYLILSIQTPMRNFLFVFLFFFFLLTSTPRRQNFLTHGMYVYILI